MNNISGLKCVTCAKEYLLSQIEYTCPDCGPISGTLDMIYDYNLIKNRLTRQSLKQNSNYSHWRYLPLLPVKNQQLICHLSVGWTPVYRAEKLENQFGLKKIWVKDDGRNPSASLKDRASSVAVVRALEKKTKTVTAASTGNAASSWAVFTALTDLRTIIFVPKKTPEAKLTQLLLYGAEVIQVNGNYDEAFELCCRAAEKWDWYNRSTAINPVLGEGKKTAALEICEQLFWQVPDYIFVPVGDGCIIQGMWKGFKEFYQLKLIDKLPKMVGVQAEGSAPLVHAWDAGTKTAKPVIPKTVADSISVGIPRDQIKALRAVRESGGFFISVSDEEILSAISTLAKAVGVFAEPAGAAGMAGLQRSIQDGLCKSNEEAVVMVTGNGLQDIEGVKKAIKTKPIYVENILEDVEEKLLGRPLR